MYISTWSLPSHRSQISPRYSSSFAHLSNVFVQKALADCSGERRWVHWGFHLCQYSAIAMNASQWQVDETQTPPSKESSPVRVCVLCSLWRSPSKVRVSDRMTSPMESGLVPVFTPGYRHNIPIIKEKIMHGVATAESLKCSITEHKQLPPALRTYLRFLSEPALTMRCRETANRRPID